VFKKINSGNGKLNTDQKERNRVYNLQNVNTAG